MNAQDAGFLQRLIESRPAFRPLAGLAAHMAEFEGVGHVQGRRVVYAEGDFLKAANILSTRGHNTVAPAGPFTRTQAPAGASEKSGALRVTEDLVAVSAVGIPNFAPIPGGFHAMPMAKAMSLPYDVLLVCENLEPLLGLSEYTWLANFYQSRRVLALFRGAPGWFRTSTAASLIQLDQHPTLAFFDFDPMGLAMAAALPRREALCLPDWGILEKEVEAQSRRNLFAQSFQECRSALDASVAKDISSAWVRMKRLSMGLDQEHFPR